MSDSVIRRLTFANSYTGQAAALRQEWQLTTNAFESCWQNAEVVKEDAKNSLRRFTGQGRDWLVKSQRLSPLRRLLGGLLSSRMRNSLRASDRLQREQIACVPVSACWQLGDREYSVQPYVDGAESLWQRAEAGKLQVGEVGAAASLLRELHRAGLAHGDAKLANFLRTDEDELFWIDLDNVMPCAAGSARQARDLARLLIDLYTWQLDTAAVATVELYLGQSGVTSRFGRRVLSYFRRFAQRHARQYGRGFFLEKIGPLRELLSRNC